ncbi:hypothetical protein K438DRAFT_1968102 [Mycena galopus ATCC 62051]|nr:hypothetical protein K438DRAFT_1968102 [Mycena galopus ATCC 62051]
MRPDYRKRRLSQGTVYSTTTPRMISQATMNPLAPEPVPRRHARHHANAHPSPDPHRQPHGQRMTFAFIVPHAAFVVSPRSATVLSSVLSLPLDARDWAHPQHDTDVPSTRGSRSPQCMPPLIASSRVLAILSAVPTLHSNPDLGTHYEHDAHAMHVAYPCAATVFSGAPPSARNHVLSCSASMTRTTTSARCTRCSSPITRITFIPSPRPLTICAARPRHAQPRQRRSARLPCPAPPRTSVQSPAPSACAADIPHSLRCIDRIRPPRRSFPPSHRPTPAPPVFSTKTTAIPACGAASTDGVDLNATAPAKSEKMRSRCSSRNYAVRAAAPAAFRERQPTASAQGRGGGGLLTAGLLLVRTIALEREQTLRREKTEATGSADEQPLHRVDREGEEDDALSRPGGRRGLRTTLKTRAHPHLRWVALGRVRETDAEEVLPPSSLTATDGGRRGIHEAAPIYK